MDVRRSEQKSSHAAPPIPIRLICLCLALITLAVYLPVRHHEFLNYDDPDYVSNNSVVQAGLSGEGLVWAFTTSHADNWHPLTWLSHMLDCQLFGLNAGTQLVENVLFHAANAILLLLLLLRLTRAFWPAVLVAALFAWHPLHVESVAWISERKDVLSTFFGLLALWQYVAYGQQKQSENRRVDWKNAEPSRRGSAVRHFNLALLFLALGLLAKPMLVTLPFVFLLLDAWPLQRLSLFQTEPANVSRQAARGNAVSEIKALVLEKWPFFCLVAISCLLTFFAQRKGAVVPTGEYPIVFRMENALISYWLYLAKAIWPMKLAVGYPLQHWRPWQAALAGAGIVLVSALGWRMRRRRPGWIIGWLWFLGTLVPVIGIVQVGEQAIADRYTYFPLIGIFVAVIYEAGEWVGDRRPARAVAGVVAGVVLAMLVALTERQLRVWENTESLFRHALAVTQNNSIAHLGLGAVLENQGRSGEALTEYREALRLKESFFEPTPTELGYRIKVHLLLAGSFQQLGRRDDAVREYREAIRLDPMKAEAHNDLANLLDEMGQTDEALKEYREALRLQPDAPVAHDNLGTILVKLGRYDDGMKEYAEAVRLKPDDPRPHYLMGKAALRQGQSAEAVRHFRDALRIAPGDYQSLTFLARVLSADMDAKVRNGTEAMNLAEQANGATGDAQPFVLDTLAMAYAEAGRFPEARQAIQRAIELAAQAGETNSLPGLQDRQRLYGAAQPYREDFSVKTGSP